MKVSATALLCCLAATAVLCAEPGMHFGETLQRGSPTHVYAPPAAPPEDSLLDQWVVKFKSSDVGVARSFAQAHGLSLRDLAHKAGGDALKNVFILHSELKLGRELRAQIVNSMAGHRDVEWVEQQYTREQSHRALLLQDPQYSNQWHLHNNAAVDLNMESAWNRGYTGKNVQIAVVDDGLQWTHPDLSNNYRTSGSYDFNSNDPDPYPDLSADQHGTRAAGCAGAESNNVCGVGTAPEVGLAGIRLISAATTDAMEASALSYMYNTNDIFTNSWGPPDTGRVVDGPGRLTSAAMEDAIDSGRGGKGAIYVWAGGNGLRNKDNGNYDGYNNKIYTISIASHGKDGKQSYYSENCSCLFASAPSSSTPDLPYITTCARTDSGTCTSQFSGTSASAPMAAGVLALALQARPELTWRDLQHVIVKSVRQINPTSNTWITNGAGIPFSHQYGFGALDAGRLIDAALSHDLVEESVYVDSGVMNPTENILNGYKTLEYSVSCGADIVIEHLQLAFDITTTSRGAIAISVISPMGSLSQMTEAHSDSNADWHWLTSSNAHWGESSFGAWRVRFENTGSRSATINSFRMYIDGTMP